MEEPAAPGASVAASRRPAAQVAPRCGDGAVLIASPAIRDNLLYIGDMDGKFYAIDIKSGQPKWTHSAEAEIDNGANFWKDNVLFGSQDSKLYCLNAVSGEVVWKFAIQDQIRCMPTVVGDRSFVAGCDSTLHIIDLNEGKEAAGVPIEAPTVREHHQFACPRKGLEEVAGGQILDLEHQQARLAQRRQQGRGMLADAVIRQVHGAKQIRGRPIALLDLPEQRLRVLGRRSSRQDTLVRIGALHLLQDIDTAAGRRASLVTGEGRLPQQQRQSQRKEADQTHAVPSTDVECVLA
jgi:hypothetical protein